MNNKFWQLISLALVLLLLCFLSMNWGAVEINFIESMAILTDSIGWGSQQEVFSPQQFAVFWSIRMPRLLLSVFVGSALAVSGASMQGLFRNPLVEPGLIGVSSGAALMAVLVIVFGNWFPPIFMKYFGVYLLPLAAFVGALLTTILSYKLGSKNGRTDISVLILAGVAINALAGALIGLIIYYSDDSEMRTFTFWSMGDLSGATWTTVATFIPFLVVSLWVLLRRSSSLNVIALGESEAQHLGVNVQSVKRQVILGCALAVGASVALTGMIGFVGLIIPHILRSIFGPDHRIILPFSVVSGAILLLLADLLARTIVMPSELPIGILTAILGAPFFTYLLIKIKRKRFFI